VRVVLLEQLFNATEQAALDARAAFDSTSVRVQSAVAMRDIARRTLCAMEPRSDGCVRVLR
jgi:hypothetical protein